MHVKARDEGELFKSSGFSATVLVVYPPRYEVRPSKGFGLCLFATRNVNMGGLIVAERPLVLLRTDVHRVGDLPPQQLREIRRMLVEHLEAKDREEFFALPNCKGYSRPEISGIIDTNSLGVA